LRRWRLDDDVRRNHHDWRRPPTLPHASRPQRRPLCGAPHQPVRGASERLPGHAVQQEVGGEVDVEEVLGDFLDEDEKPGGHVGRVDG